MLSEKDFSNNPLFKRLDSLSLSPDEYLIMGSGIMFALGIRELNQLDDLDIFVSTSAWEKVMSLSENIYYEEWSCSHLYLFDNGIEIWNGWGPRNYDFKELHKRAYFVGKYPFESLIDTLEWKKTMGREKDKKHIQMIEDFLKVNPKFGPVSNSF